MPPLSLPWAAPGELCLLSRPPGVLWLWLWQWLDLLLCGVVVLLLVGVLVRLLLVEGGLLRTALVLAGLCAVQALISPLLGSPWPLAAPCLFDTWGGVAGEGF